ncbi:quaternary amine ABC transporter ATP-binding protein [Bosea psychrotolerans]|uniref:Quaternary amine transport ATP-binding protein n=1 Tax=Bosea psychrotolerans TaxID=1871628 RepID=A0A2S4LXJ2_9HYPH|nr:glycine betaine/L-proline ABC transporter ATP-binding protein [Bosea psychrotolerans]POR47174.1 glycine betaine/proline transport system ATP-binding protein [Bosea psychrotolerans]
MTERLQIQNLYKIFSAAPEAALQILANGGDKSTVFDKLGAVVGLNNVSLSVPQGAMYMVMGLSGSGKSTLARCINRLNEPSAGKILLDGRDIVPLREEDLREVRRTRISMVFQHFALLPNKRVIENVEFGLKLRGASPADRRRRADEVLSVVGLARWGYHFPHELSGGMRQRVGLARALATDADILIMDEAFSALDPLIRTEMQDELLRLQRTLNKTILFITHDFQEALKLGTRIAIMSEGELVREGTPQSIVLEPGSDYVAAFTREIDRARLFDARSVMREAAPILRSERGILVGGAEAGDPGFVLDGEGRILGALDGAALGHARQSGEIGTPSSDYVSVPENAKLIEVARSYRNGRPMAVIDEDGRLVGTLGVGELLSRMSSTSPKTASAGDRHV